MSKTHIFANWKMYLGYDQSNILANQLANEFKKIPENLNIAVFANDLSLYSVGLALKEVNIGFGGQNAYWVDKGGYTGASSMVMLKEIGCQYVLIGHSERRHVFGETNHDVRQKMEAALQIGLTPVLCVGETQKERDEGKTEEAVEIQLRAALDDLKVGSETKIIIAYEPVWAIGTGNACDPNEAERMHGRVKTITTALLPDLEIPILYGGSVKAENVADYIHRENIAGALIGNASANFESFKEIINRVAV